MRVQTLIGFNAKSIHPRTGKVHGPDAFTPVAKGAQGTVVETWSWIWGEFSLVQFDGLTTPQELRTSLLKTVS